MSKISFTRWRCDDPNCHSTVDVPVEESPPIGWVACTVAKYNPDGTLRLQGSVFCSTDCAMRVYGQAYRHRNEMERV